MRRLTEVASFVVGVIALSLATTGMAGDDTPRVAVSPKIGLLDAPFGIRVTGVAANQEFRLQLDENAYPAGKLTVSRVARSNGHGVIDLHHSSLLGLVEPAPGTPNEASPHYTRLSRITLHSGHKTLATTTSVRFIAASSVRSKRLRPSDSGFYGEYLRPANAKSHTAVLLIGGSEGGMPNDYAASLLASHGYPVLRLAYFDEPGLPPALERVPLEYFKRALTWLSKRPEVDPKQISVIGASRGGEAALILGGTFPDLIHSVVAYVPNENINPAPHNFSVPAWTLSGKPLAAGPIPVEQINGPVFVVGAAQDHVWLSSSAVIAIERRMHAHGRNDITALDYGRAGHGVGEIVPNLPTRPTVKTPHGTLDLGGSLSGNAAACADSWPRLLRFLSRLS